MKVGICGTGVFADRFIPLFKAHPAVEQVVLCDLDSDKLRQKAAKFDIRETSASLDGLCAADVDAIAIITQPERHGPQAVQALRAGKHVYSAVPSAWSLDEISLLVRTVQETGLTYMVGETSYYYPCAIYCRRRCKAGDFGHVVYGEAEYHHDISHGLYDVSKWRWGKDWKRFAGKPPLYYPTHSVSMIVSVTGAHVTHVSAMGFVDRHPDGLYGRADAIWQNEFSNEVMMCRMSDGSIARFNEFRRIGHPGTVGMSLYGTEGGYEEQVGGKRWITKELDNCLDVTAELACEGVPSRETSGLMSHITSADGTHQGVSRVHDVQSLPREFIGLPNGHRGSHQFLVRDFVESCITGKKTPNNVWQAARYLIPGLLGHESALKGGELMEVPDLGDPPGDDG